MKLLTGLLLAAHALVACAAQAPRIHPAESLAVTEKPPQVASDDFKRDRATALPEAALQTLVTTPVALDESQRVGILCVTAAYAPDREVPITGVPAELTRALEAAGVFAGASEMTTDWPTDGSISGLRELAARYRSAYLLLYRDRFVDTDRTNAWAWLYPTILGAILAPSRTLETEGVLEATLFDVRTGTIVFTVYERVRGRSDETPFDGDRKLRELKGRLLQHAESKLAEEVVAKVRRLVGDRKPAS
jgi:hypothetical protein